MKNFSRYRKHLSENAAIETLIFDQFHWPLRDTIRSQSYKDLADEIYEEIKEESFRNKKSPVEYLWQKNTRSYLDKKFKDKGIKVPPSNYVNAIEKILENLEQFQFSLREWYKKEGIDEIYRFLKDDVQGIGEDTANRIVISCSRILRWKLPKDMSLPRDVKQLLRKLGLDENEVLRFLKNT